MEFKEVIKRIEAFGAQHPTAQVVHAHVVLHEGGDYGQQYEISLPVGLRAVGSPAGDRSRAQTVDSPLTPPDTASAAAEKPAGEASAASSGKKSRAKTAAAKEAPASPAVEEDLFGSASTATPQKTAAAQKSAPETASPSEEDDLFGEKTAPAADKPKATIEQLRKALTECQTKHGHKDHALGVLKKHTRDGNPTISTLDEAKYQDVIDACAKYVPAK